MKENDSNPRNTFVSPDEPYVNEYWCNDDVKNCAYLCFGKDNGSWYRPCGPDGQKTCAIFNYQMTLNRMQNGDEKAGEIVFWDNPWPVGGTAAEYEADSISMILESFKAFGGFGQIGPDQVKGCAFKYTNKSAKAELERLRKEFSKLK